jgi:hypothetical protein
MDFASGFTQGWQIGEYSRSQAVNTAIDRAGLEVKTELEKEKEFKRQKELEAERLQQQQLQSIIGSNTQPRSFQQGDSLGLEGYNVGNKPVQTTVPTAPAGYGTREDGTTTDQTLVGNYGTTSEFKGEKPTTEDTLKMQQDKPIAFGETSSSNVVDLAQVKSAVTPQDAAKQETSPKVLDTLNNQITAADNAKESYNYNMRVIRKLQDSGNARAALEYQSKVANAELTLSQADHTKFTTVQGIAKQVGNMADNVLETMQQPGADINKLYYDFGDRIKNEFNYTGKIPFSLDPRENMKTLQQFRKDAMTTVEKSDDAIKIAVAQRDNVYKQSTLMINHAELQIKQLTANLALSKENREVNQATINNLAEGIKLKQKVVDSLNSVQDKDLKKQYSQEINASMAILDKASKDLKVKPIISMDNSSTITGATNVQPGTSVTQPGAAPVAATPANSTQSVNNAFLPEAVQQASGAGGYVNPTPVVKSKQEIANDSKRKKELTARLNKIDFKLSKKDQATPALNPIGDIGNLIDRRINKYKGDAKKAINEITTVSDEDLTKERAKIKAELDRLG